MKKIYALTNNNFSNFNSSAFWTRREPSQEEFEQFLNEKHGEFKTEKKADIARAFYNLNVDYRRYTHWEAAYKNFLNHFPELKTAVETIISSFCLSTACSW